MHREHDSTPWLLEQWAAWTLQAHGLKPKYPGMTTFRRLSKTTSTPSPMICDLCAVVIDATVARVCHANREAGAALVYTHLLHWPASRVANHLGIDRRRVLALVRLGEASVSELLDADP